VCKMKHQKAREGAYALVLERYLNGVSSTLCTGEKLRPSTSITFYRLLE